MKWKRICKLPFVLVLIMLALGIKHIREFAVDVVDTAKWYVSGNWIAKNSTLKGDNKYGRQGVCKNILRGQ